MTTRCNPFDPSGGMALGSGDLVLAAATLSPGGDTPLAVAIDAAVAGGFGGLSLWASTYVAELAHGSSPAELRQSVVDAGLVVDHVEAVIGWVGPGDPGGPYAEEATRSQVFEAGTALGASLVSVLLFGPRGTSEDDAAEVFSGIAAEAEKHGLRAALEFAPGTAVRDVATAARVTAPAPGGGILYDTWHAHFGPSTLADLEQVPGERILAVQVSDGLSERSTDHAWATRRHRLVPGEGAADPRGTIAALRATGCRSPLTVEVFNDEMVAELGPCPFAVRLHHSLRAAFPSRPTAVR